MKLCPNDEHVSQMDISHLLSVCYTLDSFSKFNDNLIEFMSDAKNAKNRYYLWNIANKKHIIGLRKVKKFYQQNKKVIDEIDRCCNINIFIGFNYDYDYNGNCKMKSSFETFYKYLIEHRDEKKQIVSLLKKLRDLGFTDICFNEEDNFVNTTYSVSCNMYSCSYMENMEALPNYSRDYVYYKTTGSNYRIDLGGKISSYGPYWNTYITVNNLLFDPSLLPDNISKETTYDKILSLKDSQKENCNSIERAVDLSVSIDDLYNAFDFTDKVVNGFEDVKDKKQLKKKLSKIKEYLDDLKKISDQYDDSICENNSKITKEQLKLEKAAYLSRRHWSSIDID